MKLKNKQKIYLKKTNELRALYEWRRVRKSVDIMNIRWRSERLDKWRKTVEKKKCREKREPEKMI